MRSEVAKLIEAIHSSKHMASIAVAGAGTQAIGWILGVAGASRTVLDIQVPYSGSAVVDYLGEQPEQFVSEETARRMARAAYLRAASLADDDSPLMGVACTATIATDRLKRGEHRCHVAVHYSEGALVKSLTLKRGRRDRAGEDEVVSTLVLNAIAETAGLVPYLIVPNLLRGEVISRSAVCFRDPLDALAHGHVGSVLVRADGTQRVDPKLDGGVFPGSFNPLHGGHLELKCAGERILDAPVCYEVSITNVDKLPLEPAELRTRLAQFAGVGDVLVTNAPVFYKKAQLVPGCTFVIGVDTLERLIDPKYYDGSPSKMRASLREMRDHRCGFLVAGRVDRDGFKTLRNIALLPEFEEMFSEIPETSFRNDVSSTEIRTPSKRC